MKQPIMEKTAYLPAKGFEAELEAEIGPVTSRIGRLLLTDAPALPSIWAQNIWYEPEIIAIESVKKVAAALRARQRNWALYDYAGLFQQGLHGKAKLIQENLPHISSKLIVFPLPPPTAPMGSWTLVDDKHIIASSRCSSAYRNGEVIFDEDKTEPPNRAYLKLWEFFTVSGAVMQPGALCLDLGASPGGWSWVLSRLGARVISIDKAPLAPHIAAMPRIDYRPWSAFALEPKTHEPVDWLFSDIACYPERLLKLVQRWLDSGKVKNFCCTIKLQGDTDHEAVRAFAAIEGSHVRHLYNNKHELTWWRLAPEGAVG